MFQSIFHLLDLDHYNASVSLFVSPFSLKPADNDIEGKGNRKKEREEKSRGITLKSQSEERWRLSVSLSLAISQEQLCERFV